MTWPPHDLARSGGQGDRAPGVEVEGERDAAVHTMLATLRSDHDDTQALARQWIGLRRRLGPA